MPRLFASDKDLAFISDINKELIKDIIGQKINYYSISEMKTRVHTVYNESPEKIFDDPITIECLADSPVNETHFDRFGFEEDYKLEIYIQWRDLVDKGVTVSVGDFFQYGENFYEISAIQYIKTIYGQIEHKDGIKVNGTKARDTQFKEKLFGPTDYSEVNGEQKEFVQQRGMSHNKLGETGDKRELQEREILEKPLTGAKEISELGDLDGKGPSFYGE